MGLCYGKLDLQNLQFHKNKALKINKDNYNACMQLSKDAQDDLLLLDRSWWLPTDNIGN